MQTTPTRTRSHPPGNRSPSHIVKNQLSSKQLPEDERTPHSPNLRGVVNASGVYAHELRRRSTSNDLRSASPSVTVKTQHYRRAGHSGSCRRINEERWPSGLVVNVRIRSNVASFPDRPALSCGKPKRISNHRHRHCRRWDDVDVRKRQVKRVDVYVLNGRDREGDNVYDPSHWVLKPKRPSLCVLQREVDHLPSAQISFGVKAHRESIRDCCVFLVKALVCVGVPTSHNMPVGDEVRLCLPSHCKSGCGCQFNLIELWHDTQSGGRERVNEDRRCHRVRSNVMYPA